MSEFARQFIISWAGVLVALSQRFPGGDGKFAGEAVPHFGAHVLASGRQVHSRGVVGAWAGHFIFEQVISSSYFAEIANATGFVFGKKVISLLVDAKYNRVCARARQVLLLFVLLMRFPV